MAGCSHGVAESPDAAEAASTYIMTAGGRADLDLRPELYTLFSVSDPLFVFASSVATFHVPKGHVHLVQQISHIWYSSCVWAWVRWCHLQSSFRACLVFVETRLVK